LREAVLLASRKFVVCETLPRRAARCRRGAFVGGALGSDLARLAASTHQAAERVAVYAVQNIFDALGGRPLPSGCDVLTLC
jgi:hypothetical protein